MHCLPSSFEHCVILAAYSLTAMFCVSCIIALHLLTYFMKCLMKYFVVFSEDLRQHWEVWRHIWLCCFSGLGHWTFKGIWLCHIFWFFGCWSGDEILCTFQSSVVLVPVLN